MEKLPQKRLIALSKIIETNQKKQLEIVDSMRNIVDDTILSLIEKNMNKLSKYDRKRKASN